MFKWFYNYLAKIQAEGRQERFIGNPGDRGRVLVKTKLKPSITARVYRAATGKWEDLGRIN